VPTAAVNQLHYAIARSAHSQQKRLRQYLLDLLVVVVLMLVVLYFLLTDKPAATQTQVRK
jgi:K+-transporting ATPase A subunit